MISRADLAPGDQAVQAAHAALKFAYDYPDTVQKWITGDQVLAFLAASDELALARLWESAVHHGLHIAGFREPDLDWELTALAVEPAGWRLVKHLPLALRGGES